MEELKPAGYSVTNRSDAKSVAVLEGILNIDKVISHLTKYDKIPNYDGYLELINNEGIPIGELKVQVKTLRKRYKNPSYSIKFQLLQYVKGAVQIPFILIAIDQKLKKAYWKFLSKDISESLLKEREKLKIGQKTIAIKFDKKNEISSNEPYDEWTNIVKKNLQSISGFSRSRTIKINIDNSKPYLDQVNTFVSKLFSEINFIPTHILANAEFIIKNDLNTNNYCDNYVFITSNSKLFKLFNSLVIVNEKLDSNDHKLIENVEEYKSKLQFIVNKLSNSFIHYISDRKTQIKIKHFNNINSCDCKKCLLYNLEFDLLKNKLNEDESDLESYIVKAYTNYKLGNYIWSAEQLLKAKEIASKEDKHLSKFIIQYNLSKLYLLLRNNFLNDNAPKKLLEILEEVDIDKEYRNYDDETYFPIVDWIYREKFLHDAEKKIRRLKEQIIKQYNSSIRGGGSYNTHSSSIISEMVKIELFLQDNFIIYDIFIEYSELVKEFTEGVFASHAIVSRDNDKLSSLNDWILRILINYSNTDQLISLFNRYKLQKLVYETSNPKGSRISDFIIKLIGEFNIANNIAKAYFQKGNKSFSHYQTLIIRNAIVIASQITFKPETISKIAKIIVGFVTHFGVYGDMKYIEYFFTRNGKHISSLNFKKILLAGIKNPRFHYQSFFESISDSAETNGVSLKLTESQFTQIIKMTSNNCKYCNEIHSPNYLTYFHRIIDNENQKQNIELIINEYLKQQFDFELFESSIVFNIITLEDKLLSEAIKKAKPHIQTKGRIQTLFRGNKEERYYKLNSLLNICFKEEINLSDPKFDSLREISNYYDWLLDMENFDYSLFDPNWINEYVTRFYFKRMYQSKQLRLKLDRYLRTNESHYEQNIMNVYLNIYVRKSWDV